MMKSTGGKKVNRIKNRIFSLLLCVAVTVTSFNINIIKATATVNYYYDAYEYTIYTYIDKGYGAISENQLVEPNQNTSIYYYPANGYDVEYVKIGTTNNNLSAETIDILKVFENVQSDHYVHVAFKIAETKKSEITKSAYNWIDLKIN